MTTQFPNNLDTFVNPTATDEVSVVSHADQHADANDAIEALQAKVGINGSLVDTSIDFKLSNVADGDKAVAVADYDNKIDSIEGDITDLETADGQNVKLTGNQTVAGVKTFSSSPIVPDPTTATQATNKQWVEGYVTSTGKESVGLFTQGSFVDRFTMDLEIKSKQSLTEQALTGFPTTGSSIDTLDGTNFIVAGEISGDLTFGEYSLSGTTFSPIMTLAIINTYGSAEPVCKYIDANTAVVASTNTDRVYVHLITKTGVTWDDVDNDFYTLPGASASTRVRDIFIDGSDIYVAVSYLGQDVYIVKAEFTSSTIGISGTWTAPVIGDPNTTSNARFASETEIFVAYGTVIQKYTFSSGTATQVGSNGTIVNGTAVYIINVTSDEVVIRQSSSIDTLEFDGTNFSLISTTRTAGTGYYLLANGTSTSPTVYFTEDAGYKVTLGAQGIEDSITDTSANGHLRYMSSLTQTGFGGQTLTLSGTVSNDGDYVTTNTDSGSIDKVLLSTAPVAPEIVSDAVVTTKFANNNTEAWVPKGSNYYLGQN